MWLVSHPPVATRRTRSSTGVFDAGGATGTGPAANSPPLTGTAAGAVAGGGEAAPGEGTGTFSDFAKSLREMHTEEFDFDFRADDTFTSRRATVEVRGVRRERGGGGGGVWEGGGLEEYMTAGRPSDVSRYPRAWYRSVS